MIKIWQYGLLFPLNKYIDHYIPVNDLLTIKSLPIIIIIFSLYI